MIIFTLIYDESTLKWRISLQVLQDLGGYQLVIFSLGEVDQGSFGHFVEGLAVLLGKGEEQAVPSHRKLAFVIGEGKNILG